MIRHVTLRASVAFALHPVPARMLVEPPRPAGPALWFTGGARPIIVDGYTVGCQR